MESTAAQPTDTRPALNPQQVADALGISQSKTYSMLEDGELPGFKIGTAWRVRRSDLDAWIDQQTRRET